MLSITFALEIRIGIIQDNFIDFLVGHSPIEKQAFQLGDVVTTEDDNWTMETETNALQNGVHFYALRSCVHQDFDLVTENGLTPGRFTSRFVESGAVDLRLPDAPRFHVNHTQGLMFSPKVGTSRAFYEGGTNINLVTFNASIHVLEEMMEHDPSHELEALLNEDHSQGCIVPVPVSREMRVLFASTHSSELTGILRHIQLEGIALHLLALQLHAIGNTSNPSEEKSLSASIERKILEAREYLLSDLYAPPTLSKLSASAGMSERRLNTCFKILFGATAFELLHNERLEIARQILETEDVLLKQVSHRVGYNHVTNFINAFTRRFGQPPRQYLNNNTGE